MTGGALEQKAMRTAIGSKCLAFRGHIISFEFRYVRAETISK
jgi:hypothetical protein